MTPKGSLLIIGGSEDKGIKQGIPAIKEKNREFTHLEILGSLIPENLRKKQTVEIITTATEHPVEIIRIYRRTLKAAGYQSINFMNMENKDEARNPDLLNRIDRAHSVLFSGGDQFRLSTILGGSPLVEAINAKYIHEKDFVVAGTSAGAMVMSKLMIYRGDNLEALLKGEIKITSGFGFIDNCIIDTHFVKRGRFGRLAQAVITNPSCIGLGLGEDTALIIKKGNIAECRGSGMVIVIDGSNVGHTNIAYADEDTPICIEGLQVHILAKGNKFYLRERKFIPDPQDIRREDTDKKASR